MRLKINLATRRYVDTRALNLSIGCLIALLGALLLFWVQEAAYNAGELKRLQDLGKSAAQPGKTAQVSESQYRALQGKIHFANQMLQQKSLDWTGLLDRLEEVVPAGVALTDISPSMKDRELKLTGAARSFKELRALLENLEQSRNFSEVYLLSQQETKVGLTQHGILFSVSCKVPQL